MFPEFRLLIPCILPQVFLTMAQLCLRVHNRYARAFIVECRWPQSFDHPAQCNLTRKTLYLDAAVTLFVDSLHFGARILEEAATLIDGTITSIQCRRAIQCAKCPMWQSALQRIALTAKRKANQPENVMIESLEHISTRNSAP
jgi:hypothetical protein